MCKYETPSSAISVLLFEILCYTSIIFLPYSYQLSGWIGVLVYTTTITTSTVVLDFTLSPTAEENVDRIAKTYKVHRLAGIGIILPVVSVLFCLWYRYYSAWAPLWECSFLKQQGSIYL